MNVSVSVVMAVYNGGKHLRAAIDSILSQSFRDFEFVIVNDGSTDESLLEIQSYRDSRIRVIDQRNSGLSASLNRGVAESIGKYVARMDADDIAHADRLRLEFDFLETEPSCVAVGGNANFIDEEGRYLYTSKCPISWEEIRKALPRSPFFHPAVMFRKIAFEQAGGYLEPVSQFFEDQVLWNRMAKFGELRNLQDVVLDYRIGKNSITASKERAQRLNEICERVLKLGYVSDADAAALGKARSTKVPKRLKAAGYHLRLGKIHLEYAFDRKRALMHLLRSAVMRPTSPVTWFNLMLVPLPRTLIQKWKASRGVYEKVW